MLRASSTTHSAEYLRGWADGNQAARNDIARLQAEIESLRAEAAVTLHDANNHGAPDDDDVIDAWPAQPPSAPLIPPPLPRPAPETPSGSICNLRNAVTWLVSIRGRPNATDAAMVLSLGAVCVSWRDTLAAGVKSAILHSGARVQRLRWQIERCRKYAPFGDALAKVVPRLAAMTSLEMRRAPHSLVTGPKSVRLPDDPESDYNPFRRR
jgi:hypothetical protein